MGCLLPAALFLRAALHKTFNPEGTQQYMAAYGLSTGISWLYRPPPWPSVREASRLRSGIRLSESVVLLILFMVMVTGIFHARLTDPNQGIRFVKNVAIIGGLTM